MDRPHESVTSIRLPDGVRLWATLRRAGTTAAHAGTAVEQAGAGTPGGLTLVLLHGWTLDSRLWHRQWADLPARLASLPSGPAVGPGAPRLPSRKAVSRPGGIRMLAYDLRGHGRSGPTAIRSATLEQLADDLLEVLRVLAADQRVVLVGHSLGGMAIVEYAHRHRADFTARVAGVVLVNSSAEGALHTTYGLSAGLARALRLFEVRSNALLARLGPWNPHRHLMPALGPAVRWLVFGRRAEPEWVRLVVQMVAGASLRSIGAFRPAIDVHRRIEALAAMREIPLTALVGALDRLTPPACAAAIVAGLPHARLRVVEDAGHMLPLERPDVVTDAIVDVCRQAATIGRPVEATGAADR